MRPSYIIDILGKNEDSLNERDFLLGYWAGIFPQKLLHFFELGTA